MIYHLESGLDIRLRNVSDQHQWSLQQRLACVEATFRPSIRAGFAVRTRRRLPLPGSVDVSCEHETNTDDRIVKKFEVPQVKRQQTTRPTPFSVQALKLKRTVMETLQTTTSIRAHIEYERTQS